MELLPAMGFGWLNGWVLVVAFAAYFAVLVNRLPAATRAWLFDTRGWTRAQRILSGGSKVFVLACLVLFVVTPLKLDRPVFVAGVLLYAVGLFVLTAALREYRNGAADEPATRGVYGRSRNPQVLAIGVVFIGIVLAIGSGTALMLYLVSAGLYHFRILGEERACLAKYGPSYEEYMARVPRYVGFGGRFLP